jgi:adenylosuccinate lyase
MTVLSEFGAFPEVINAELTRYLPFLATTKILVAAVKAGVGREVAHEVIKEHAVSAALGIRQGKPNTMIEALAADPRMPLDKEELEALLSTPLEFTGDSMAQTTRIINRIAAITAQHQDAASYRPASIR